MASVGAILGIISSALGAVGSVAGASKGPGGSQLANQQRGGFQYRPTALGAAPQVNVPGNEEQMRLSDILRLTQS